MSLPETLKQLTILSSMTPSTFDIRPFNSNVKGVKDLRRPWALSKLVPLFAPAMLQCRAGHLLCAPCRSKWRCRRSCPTCRGPLKPPMRNTALEQVAATIGLSSESCSAEVTTAISTHGEELAALFVCPVCFEHVQPPILQCRAGHLLCNECRPRVSSCPCCREPLTPDSRNVAMETLATMVPFPSEVRDQLSGKKWLALHQPQSRPMRNRTTCGLMGMLSVTPGLCPGHEGGLDCTL
ncbi:E3 ubiquitin-protein ligase SIAH1A [Amia ocellicauda]|uniref:E3 ubiquitin-protein ligase SIAH1A n=1 Tax=Amia ocellicauda TaxID=2972642 RepID=UPI003464C3EC